MLQDAAEELTFQHGEKEEKTLARRTIGDALRKGEPSGIKQIQQILEKLGDLHQDVLERTLQVLLRMSHADSLALRQQVRQQLPEPGHQYAALMALAERLREEGAPPAQRAAVEQALRELEQEQGPAIRAALNVSGVATEFAAARLGELQSLRETYRDTVLDAPDLVQTFNILKDRYGESELRLAINYLLKALAADLAADGSSIDRHKLNAVLNDIYRLELLTGLLEDCATLVNRYAAPQQGIRSTDLLGELLDLQGQSWLRPELIAPLPARIGVCELTSEIKFLREFKDLTRMIPLKAYADTEQRPRLLDAIQQAMDSAIEREEAEGS